MEPNVKKQDNGVEDKSVAVLLRQFKDRCTQTERRIAEAEKLLEDLCKMSGETLSKLSGNDKLMKAMSECLEQKERQIMQNVDGQFEELRLKIDVLAKELATGMLDEKLLKIERFANDVAAFQVRSLKETHGALAALSEELQLGAHFDGFVYELYDISQETRLHSEGAREADNEEDHDNGEDKTNMQRRREGRGKRSFC
eukprot:TRINITY_DN65815_c0_g1_i1.p2 TRINITY_DN65815_c0_g1~~TRINITY_DN65815_c0_g1_i1.p2  ORF type:complete len:199 (+),score=66.79 TRINITY_DN65815_c0_g1_i1:306-902(+)